MRLTLVSALVLCAVTTQAGETVKVDVPEQPVVQQVAKTICCPQTVEYQVPHTVLRRQVIEEERPVTKTVWVPKTVTEMQKVRKVVAVPETQMRTVRKTVNVPQTVVTSVAVAPPQTVTIGRHADRRLLRFFRRNAD